MKRLFQRRSALHPSPAGMVGMYLLLGLWTCVVLFPLYWLLITSLKLPIQVDSGPFYLPWIDFQPSLHAWQYIFVDLRNDTLRPYINTIIVAAASSVLALALGATAAYALVRFTYRPRMGVVGLFIGCIVLVVIALQFGVPWPVAVAAALAVFVLLVQTIGRRFRRTLGNDDIAFWMISQRILPPVAVVIPIYILLQQVGLLDTHLALIITYVSANLPIAVWLMRDYFASIPLELEECAAIDGASRYQIFTAIVLPLSAPGLVATLLFVMVFAWNEYLLALFLSSANAQTMPLLVAAQNATRGPQWWYMSVLILIMIIPVIGMAIALERYIARGLLVGAIKG
ncbi:MAG: carbohydrate ABC transporter permease [Chloroflexales bacterium]|nr:carbohydrate ABC transporter permease [Chloroflexales bacterium]